MEDDVDFIRDVLETKVYKLFQNVGIQKKVSIMNSTLSKRNTVFLGSFPGCLQMEGRSALSKCVSCCNSLQEKVKLHFCYPHVYKM